MSSLLHCKTARDCSKFTCELQICINIDKICWKVSPSGDVVNIFKIFVKLISIHSHWRLPIYPHIYIPSYLPNSPLYIHKKTYIYPGRYHIYYLFVTKLWFLAYVHCKIYVNIIICKLILSFFILYSI